MAIANQTPQDVASQYAAMSFVIRQLASKMATATLVRVMNCTNSGGLDPVGTVTVQLLVDQITEDGQTIPHGSIFKVPYSRLQGGANAVILDPQPGDLGICVFASRDISAIKSDPDAARNRQPIPGAPPGSWRTYSYADALYVGGVLNAAPTQFVQFSEDGITVTSPIAVTINAPLTTVNGDLDCTGTIHGAVDVIADTISGKIHTHTSENVGDPTGPPM